MYRTTLVSSRTILFCFLIPFYSALVCVHGVEAQTTIKLLLTSNIQGKSSPDVPNQEEHDPLLVLAQNIVAEKEATDVYLDLGNAFYPGVISKFSSGSIMMDFLDGFDCKATLVSSKDLHIGLQNLDFLRGSRNVKLLSANISRASNSVFTPYVIADVRGTKIAFIGISSKQLKFDIAEKDLYDTVLKDEKEVLGPVLKEIGSAGIDHIVLLSGMKLEETVLLLESYKQIDMAVCGGDYTGMLYESKASRIDLVDGRSILMIDDSFDYYILELALNDRVFPQAMQPRKARYKPTQHPTYLEFADRLSLWKSKYLAEQNQKIASTDGQDYLLNDLRLTQLLRARFNSEVAFVNNNTIRGYPIENDIRQSDVLNMVNLDFTVFTFDLTGAQLAMVNQNQSGLISAGISQKDKLFIQGYPIDGQRKYRVAATQPAFEKIRQILGTDISYRNSWITVTDLLTADLKNEKLTLRDDYAYLDRRFRTLIDVYLSNFVATGSVQRRNTSDTPVDQPIENYDKWGLEDRIDLTFYNQFHRFVLTPYILYVRQNDDYIQNLLRGTFLYDYNLSENIRPYNKFQVDTVVEEVDGRRPILIRETMGISTYKNFFSGKLGLGLEKMLQDPADDAVYGIELIMGVTYPFLKHFTYSFNIDNFVSMQGGDSDRWGLRTEIDNAISVRVNSYLSLSLKHKYFYLHEDEFNAEYRSSQFFTTVDLNTYWKLW